MGSYEIKDTYQAGYSAFDAKSNLTKAGSLGLTTDPRTANILKDASNKLSSGVKNIELALVNKEIFDSIPKQQFKEIKKLSELTGVGFSVHGPVMDVAGITQQGFSELNRESSERKVIDTLERSQEINPKGNVKVVFHSAEGIPGTEWKTLEEGKRKAKRLVAIDRESGKPIQLEEEKLYYPADRELKNKSAIKEINKKLAQGILTPEQAHEQAYIQKPLKEGKQFTPENRLISANQTSWDNSINQLIFNKERADEILQNNQIQIQHLMQDLNERKLSPNDLTSTQKQAYNHYQNAAAYLEETRLSINNLFNKAYKYGNKEQQEVLKQLSKQYVEDLNKVGQTPYGQSQAMQNLIHSLKDPSLAPDTLVPIEDFAVEQSSKTFGNAALNAYKKFKDKSPIINIENPPAGFGLSTGEDLKNLVKESRKQFVDQATKSKREGGLGLSKSIAEKQAEKLIGATWDVGHINMLRGQGFSDKDIIKQTEIIAPYVKHVHLSDNFGFEHTELPMGMGNVPMKKIMDKLGEKGYDAKKIIEAGQWWQHFQTPPLPEVMDELGASLYTGAPSSPYWSQTIGLQQGYFTGYGQMLPQINYQTFGAGFSQLPPELGGQQVGGGSRMSGRPME